MSYAVHAGADNPLFYDPVEQMLAMGGSVCFPLNGGSETRADARNYYADLAKALGIAFRGNGGQAILYCEGNIEYFMYCLKRQQDNQKRIDAK